MVSGLLSGWAGQISIISLELSSHLGLKSVVAWLLQNNILATMSRRRSRRTVFHEIKPVIRFKSTFQSRLFWHIALRSETVSCANKHG
jgi:hypothetical protein